MYAVFQQNNKESELRHLNPLYKNNNYNKRENGILDSIRFRAGQSPLCLNFFRLREKRNRVQVRVKIQAFAERGVRTSRHTL